MFEEIVAGPITLYLAPVGTAFPALGAAPAAEWKKVGKGGAENYDESGVAVSHPQKIETFRGAGSTGPQAAWRTEEDLMIAVALADISAEQYARALNDATLDTTAAGAGTVGFHSIGLHQGQEVATFALLAVGQSAEGVGMAAQYQVPRVFQSANPKPTYVKGKPALLELEFTALVDRNSPDDPFGKLLIQHQVAI